MAVVLFRITAFIFHFCGMLTIYDINGNVRYSTPIYIGSKRVFKLMANDYITLHFTVRNPVYFKLGDYCDVEGQGRFEVITPYQPAYDSATGGYKYELRMDAQYYKWKNKIMKFQPQFGSSETSWTLTATAETHLNQVLKNIYALAHHHNGGFNARYLYNGEKDWQISIDKSVDASAKTIAYDKTNIINALNTIAEKYECEWWVAENTIHLGKVEDDNPYIDLELGVNVASMSRSNSKENYATRIIPFGSDRNISPRYRKDLIFDVKAQKNGGNLICDTARVMQSAWFTTYTEGNNKVENLTLQVIASNGTVEKEYTGVIFNPDNADSFTERNWFKLPNGSVLDTGVRFRIVEVNDFKVKSSYFSSKYSAYDDYNNIIKNGIVTRRLMLPESHGKGYVDVENNLPEEQGVEDVVIFEEVYPKTIATVTAVETVERSETIQNDDGTETEGKFKAYIINDDFFTTEHPFKEEYIIPGKTLQITFQDGKRYKEGDDIPAGKTVGDLINPESGKLNGWTFDVHFIQAKGGASRWEIVRDNNNYIPNEIIRPHIGDQFVLVNFDTRAVDDLYVADAEKELLDRTKKYIEKLNIDPSTYDCTMMSDVMKAGLHMELGTRINLLNKAYLPITTDKDGRRWGRKSRVIGFEYNLDIPWDNPKFTIGEKPKYSKFGEITQRLDALNYSMADVSNIAATNTQSSGSEVYVIGLNDITAANDQNVYSSLRSRIEFLSRSAPETVSYQWDFEGGITVGQYLANNTGAAIDDLGNAEVNSLQARQASVIENDLSVYGVLNVAKETKAGDAVTVGTFRPGVSGAKMWIDNNGETHIETDYMEARKKFSAKEVEIQEETHVGGCQIISPAAMRCSRVVPITESGKVIAYKCFFAVENPDGVRIENQFRIGDLAKCETFNLVKRADGKTGNHYFWREVEEVGYVTEGDADYLAENGEEGFIRLSNLNGKMDMGSDAPLAGDRIVTVGNRSITERQNLIILASYGSGSPYIYQYSGINTFSLTQQNLKTAISPNGNLFTGRFVVECDDGTTKTLAEYMDDASNIDLYMMSLSNEALCVNCNDDGTIIGQQPVVNVAIYCGKKLETTWTVKIACAGCTATLSGKQITLQSVQDSTATIKVTATKAGLPTLEKTIAVASVRNGDKGDKGDKGDSGDAGQDGVYYEIEPSALVVLKDMDGVCSPSKLTCSVYQTSGNNTRNAITFSNGSASIPGVTQTILLLYQILDADGKVISNGGYPDSGLTLNESVATVEFWLHIGIRLIGKRTVPVMLDPTSMKRVFETRFEMNEKKIEAITKRVDGNSEAIAKVQQTADGISAIVEKHSGVLGDLIEGAGRNLLLKTNSGGTNWGYRSDSTAMISHVAYIDNGEYVHNPYKVSINARTDGTYERFYCVLRPEVIRVGEKYTFGVTIKLARATTVPLQFSVRIANLDGTSDLTDTAYFDVPIGIDEYRITATMSATANGEKNGTQYLLFETIPLNINKWLELTLSDEKLELGSTATAYSEAPEDREDYLYSSLSTKIDVTAKGIRSEVKASDDALDERMSIIEQTADEISTRVESAEGEISEINQKADSISLKVEDVVGVKNLVPDYSTGKSWEVRQNEGSWSKIAPTNGVYNINNTQRTVKTLRTPAFRLEANKHYTLSFTNTMTPVSSAIVKIVYGDEQTVLLDESLLIISSGTRKSFTFETGGTALEMVRVLFSVRPANLGNSSRLNVSEVMVEEGNKAHAFTDNTSGLLGTGIDISSHKIVITSDNILIQTNNGEPSMFINSEGKIYAHYIDVDNITVRRLIAGDENGARVEINPDEGHRSVEIYNEDGNLCTTLNGLTFNGGVDDFYGDAVAGQVNLGTSIKGSLGVISTGDNVSDVQDYYSSVWESKTPTKVTVNAGAIYLYARSAGFTETSELQFYNHRTTASIAMYLERCADSSFSSGVSRWLVFSKHVTADSAQIAGNPHPVEVSETNNANGECAISGNNAVSTVSGGYFRLCLQVSVSAKGAGSEAKAQWGSAIDKFGVDIKVQYTDEGYVSNFFANGFCLGVRRDAYVMVFRDATSEMNVQCKMGQYGINLSSKGIEYCHHGGGWMKAPLLIMHANVRWVSSSSAYNILNYMSCSSKAPSVNRVNKGRVLVSLPTGSPGISLANAIIHVTAKSTASKVFNASVIAVNAATVEVALANGGNFDDCDFLIDVYWAGAD